MAELFRPDGKRLRTVMQFDPVPKQLSGGGASYAFELQPDESRSVYDGECDPRSRKYRPSVSQGFTRGFSQTSDRKPRHGHDHQLKPDLQ